MFSIKNLRPSNFHSLSVVIRHLSVITSHRDFCAWGFSMNLATLLKFYYKPRNWSTSMYWKVSPLFTQTLINSMNSLESVAYNPKQMFSCCCSSRIFLVIEFQWLETWSFVRQLILLLAIEIQLQVMLGSFLLKTFYPSVISRLSAYYPPSDSLIPRR